MELEKPVQLAKPVGVGGESLGQLGSTRRGVAQPVQLAKPVQPEEPVEPVEPVNPAKSVEPA